MNDIISILLLQGKDKIKEIIKILQKVVEEKEVVNCIEGQEVKRVWYAVDDAMPDDIYGEELSNGVFLVAWTPKETYDDLTKKTHFIEMCEYYPEEKRFKPEGMMREHSNIVILGWMNPLCDFNF